MVQQHPRRLCGLPEMAARHPWMCGSICPPAQLEQTGLTMTNTLDAGKLTGRVAALVEAAKRAGA
ncbi:MAG: hypothetical protein E5X09_22270, partial [Mesorhizobium sp.]